MSNIIKDPFLRAIYDKVKADHAEKMGFRISPLRMPRTKKKKIELIVIPLSQMMQNWRDDICIRDGYVGVSASRLYTAFVEWMKNHHPEQSAPSQKAFGLLMRCHYSVRRRGKGYFYFLDKDLPIGPLDRTYSTSNGTPKI